MSAVAPAWSPTTEQMHSSRLWRFMRAHQCATYPQLCERAARDPDWFWDALVKELRIVWSAPYHAVMDVSPGLPFTRWFPGGLLNAYDSAVLRHGQSDPNRIALIGETEAGTLRQLTYGQLEEAVEQTAAGLRAIGVARGVAVGLYLPLVIENAVALLACTKLGAIAVPLFSGFGTEAIRQRLADADAPVLITADGAMRRGRGLEVGARLGGGEGAAGGLGQPDAGRRGVLVRWPPGFPGAPPCLVGGRPSRRHPPGHLPHAHPRADGLGRPGPAGESALPAPRACLDRRALDPGSVELAVRGGGARRAAHHELLGRHRVRRRPRLWKFPDAVKSRQLRGSHPRHRRRGLQRTPPTGGGRGPGD